MARVIVFIFVAGVAVGIAGTILVPRVAGPYLPTIFEAPETSVEGRVAGKLREAGRLLLTLESDRGSVLATFTERIPEVDLLVSTGDTLVISMPEYSPFVENPPIERVAKGEGPPTPAEVAIDPEAPGAVSEAAEEAAEPPLDATAPADEPYPVVSPDPDPVPALPDPVPAVPE